jgi:chromosomal replication initiator protein
MDEKKQFEETWKLVCEYLKDQNDYPELVMKLWFYDMTLESLTDNSAILMAKTDFKRDTVKNRYLGIITNAFYDVLGNDLNITIRSKESENKTTRKMTEAAKDRPDVVPERDFYSTVGNNKILNLASMPSAFSEFTFDNFVVGNSNRFAHAQAISVSDNPAKAANPLFIHGPSGLGKTHLLYAITNRLNQNFPNRKVIYVKGEEFTNQMINSISQTLMHEFREKYREADVLLVDDIQFIAGKASTQEEFFHTFNHLYENGKQIILVSDVPPRDIQRLEERLRTRFEWGVMADINPPDFELRAAIVKKKVDSLGLSFPEEVINYVAENLTDNVRQLEGAVKRISAQALLTGNNITVDLAVRCISDQVVASESTNTTIERILNEVSNKFKVSVEDLKSRKRTSNIASARHSAIYIIKKLTNSSLPAIGRMFGRDHTTVMNSLDAVEKRMATEPTYDQQIKEIIRIIKKR